MAPTAPLGRERVVKMVADGTPLPIWFGSPHPTAMILEQDGKFRVRELVIEPAGAEAAQSAAMRSRTPSWMPEHYYALGKPTGQIYAEASTRAELVELIRTMSWPSDW
jgi:hypothetical protein